MLELHQVPPFDFEGGFHAIKDGPFKFLAWALYHVGFGAILYASGSISFDVAHILLHRFMRSKSEVLRTLGYLHAVHHYFFNRSLVFNERFAKENLYLEILLEYGLQIAGVMTVYWGLWPLIHFNVLLVLSGIMVIRIIYVFAVNGKDPNHIAYKRVPVCKTWLIVGPKFHALHHVFPDYYFASVLKPVDWLYGSAYCIRGRRVLMTGATGGFGAPLKELLEKVEEARSVTTATFGKDWDFNNYSFFEEHLKDIDILILCHGSKNENAMEANCNSFVRIIEIYRKLRTEALLPPEVWAIGSEIEFHPTFGDKSLEAYAESKRAFMHYARWYYNRNDIFYRHILPSSFKSKMSSGLMSGATAVWLAMGFIRAGFQWVPASYTTVAYWHYWHFMYFVRPKDPSTLK